MADIDSVPRYIVNFYELEQRLRELLLKDVYKNMITSYPQLDTDGISDILGYIESLMPDVKYKDIKNEIDQFILYKYDGTQQIEGAVLNIPAIRNDYKVDFTFDKDVFLTGLHLNETGWKKEDTYSLKIDKSEIIYNAFTKEIGEHKHFNTYYKVDADTPVSFIFHSKSGNSRQVLVDLEYIQGQRKTISPPAPTNPDISDISNDWDVAVRMQWEENTPCDMDLHGVIGKKHVYFGNEKEDNFYLNWDYITHMDNCNPEILSVKGYNNDTLYIYIRNYNGKQLSKPVSVKVYFNKSYGIVLVKEYSIEVAAEVSATYSVCKIDLKTKSITDMLQKVNNI
ncbi:MULTISPECIES: hypothetical protein [Clostridium]|uniref:hypothetical protein n=1 Tax=Clostridium TaxID=1485 RepID=UPI000826D12C|nr:MULTISPECIES: hypothetical protein [Clostridium]PJI07035.1 hypothetical protein CUB90_03780 [Clostridium sp. CT7]